jgi:hypothetical protein
MMGEKHDHERKTLMHSSILDAYVNTFSDDSVAVTLCCTFYDFFFLFAFISSEQPKIQNSLTNAFRKLQLLVEKKTSSHTKDYRNKCS